MIEPTIEGPYGPYREGGQVTTKYKFGGTFEFEVEHSTAGRLGPGTGEVLPERWEVRLPHACDEWVIGDGAPDLLEFIAEAQVVAEWLAAR